MYKIPNIMPLYNISIATEFIKKIYIYKKNKKPIGQGRDNKPDFFAYFFSVRGIPFEVYSRGVIAVGEITAYDYNIKSLSDYINYTVNNELKLIDDMINQIDIYVESGDDIGISSLKGADQFTIFFSERELQLSSYVSSNDLSQNLKAYSGNMYALSDYKKSIESFLIT